MIKDITLLYFDGCPFVEESRKNLQLAINKINRPFHWTEIDTTSPDCPSGLDKYPSPSILIDGKDIVPICKPNQTSQSCRLTGAPSSELILEKLKSSIGDHK